jgi:hypothetical protein
MSRTYTSRRKGIVEALVNMLKQINGVGDYLTDLEGQVFSNLVFWDQNEVFPAVYVTAGSEIRDYQGGGYADRYLSLTLRCYVQDENDSGELDALLEDIETVLVENSSFNYKDKRGVTQRTHQTSVVDIVTDEGVFHPLGIGEINIQVRY